jgi:uncharacterized protein (TIGR02466 family)
MIEAWFPTLIMSEFLDGYAEKNESIKDKALALKVEYPDPRSYWVCETYHTGNVIDLREDEFFKPLIADVTNKVRDFALVYGIEKSIKCTGAWVNIAMKGDYQEVHTHPKNHFSAVYYVSTPDKCGNIVFKKENSMFPLDETSVPLSFSHCEYVVEASKLLVFPSDLHHMVKANKSDEPRICIALNFITGEALL